MTPRTKKGLHYRAVAITVSIQKTGVPGIGGGRSCCAGGEKRGKKPGGTVPRVVFAVGAGGGYKDVPCG